MTVAAIILAASPESALHDVEGVPRVRRLADVAWAGGAVPITVVAPDPEGAVQRALTGAPATYVPPAPIADGPIGQIMRGIDAALAEVTETDGLLIWPARIQWVDAETVTSLIEAHGQHPRLVLRPTYEGDVGWPVLVPRANVDGLRTLAADRMPDGLIEDLLAAGAVEWRIDVGDPGSTHDASVPREALPAFLGPAAPASGHHEWGASVTVADSDEPARSGSPLEGPALARNGQANEAEDPALDAEAAHPEP